MDFAIGQKGETMDDTIGRHAAIDSLYCGICTQGLLDLPSAQPHTEADIQKMQDLEQAELERVFELGREDARSEIIRCKDCKYWDTSGYCIDFMTQDEGGFCKWAERRQE